MQDLFQIFAIIGFLVLGTGFLSVKIENSLLTKPMIFFLSGLALGPIGLNIIRPYEWSEHPLDLLKTLTETTLAISLMGVALRIPSDYFSQNWKSLLIVLAFGMPIMWASSSLIIYYLLGFPLVLSLLIGAILTPTDPVLSSSIVTGKVAKKNLPDRLRNLISAEAGTNDGLAMPIVFLPLLIITQGIDTGIKEWFQKYVLLETLGGLLLGVILGLSAGRIQKIAKEKKFMEISSILSTTLALSLLALGLSKTISVNGLLAAFVSGVAFDRMVDAKEQKEDERIQHAVTHFFTSPIFLLLGLFAPVNEWIKYGWKGLLFVSLILLFRRLPGMLLLSKAVPQIKSLSEASMVGWFGPIGAAALYYALEAESKGQIPIAWHLTSYVIAASIIGFGLSAAPLSKLFGSRFDSADSSGNKSNHN